MRARTRHLEPVAPPGRDPDGRRRLRRGGTPSEFGYGLVLSVWRLNDLMERTGHVTVSLTRRPATPKRAWTRCGIASCTGPLSWIFLSALGRFVARTSADPDRAPTWAIESNRAERADIVFVQLPHDAVPDSTSAGLTRWHSRWPALYPELRGSGDEPRRGEHQRRIKSRFARRQVDD